MVRIPTIAAEELLMYHGKKVVFYGVSSHHKITLEIFKQLNIEVVGCYTKRLSPANFFTIKLAGVAIIKPGHLDEFVKRHDNIILQKCCPASVMTVEALAREAVRLNVELSPIPTAKILSSYMHLSVFKTLKNPFKSFFIECFWHCNRMRKTDNAWSVFLKKDVKEPIVLCLPPKTADVTLMNTFKAVNRTKELETQIVFENVWHRPRFIDRKKCEKQFGKLKILIGIRDPIAQNLSVFYQSLTNSKISYTWLYGEMYGKSFVQRKASLESYEKLLEAHDNDVQVLWNAYLDRFLPCDGEEKKRSIYASTIQEFLCCFKEALFDITDYPFDKENGYTIIKDNNTEVFIYQLEKLNSLVPELSSWVGVPFDKLEKGNEAATKWIAESYKQAQKEIEITQEYFDKCFDEPYVKHCYSEADIEKFKARWRPHIKKEV